jgi:transposase
VNKETFVSYLESLSQHRPEEFKIIVADNAAFHSTKDIKLPPNLYLLYIPPYTPELKPCEQIWKEIKKYFKRQVFSNMNKLKEWLYEKVKQMSRQTIQSITSNHHYLESFKATFNM